jgi:hypothetical protein
MEHVAQLSTAVVSRSNTKLKNHDARRLLVRALSN